MGPDNFDFNVDDSITKLLASESRLARSRRVVKEDYNSALAAYRREGKPMCKILHEHFNDLRDNMRICKMIRSLIETKIEGTEGVPESSKTRSAMNLKTTTEFNAEFETIQTEFFIIRAKEEDVPPPRNLTGGLGAVPKDSNMSKYLVQDLQPEGVGTVHMECIDFAKHVTRCTTFGEEAHIATLQSATQIIYANKFFDPNLVSKVEAKMVGKGEAENMTFAKMMVMFKEEYNIANPLFKRQSAWLTGTIREDEKLSAFCA